MTLANYCLIIAGVLPILCAGLAKSKGFGKHRRDGGYDNHDPRGWLNRQSGWQARANAAQANSFEALPLFVAGVLAAQQMQHDQSRIDLLAVSFIVLRLLYVAFYVANVAGLRSAAWIAGMGVSIALFFV
ncbi:MAPEG family protein [Roseateles amylovorans]|uniref:MAPEG family protein n=1 Tax=Roseateles amylovorans TaxID=2978473 RepID=A0ABY6AZ26_9BURK|nr:MAPEG family protein [Roseateles amylovorans]UXH76999.1 MAPEG family protein [Roseateles amylovorans]